MRATTPSNNTLRRLQHQQRNTLLYLNAYRFGNSSTLQSALNLSQRSQIHKILNSLERRGYIAKKYDKRYRLNLRGGEYYLLPKAFSVIRENANYNPNTLRKFHASPQLTQTNIKHCLSVFQIRNRLVSWYPDVEVVTKFENTDGNLPKPSPDAELRLNSQSFRRSQTTYFMELLDNATMKRSTSSFISKYCSYTFKITMDRPRTSVKVLCFYHHPYGMKNLQKFVRRMSYGLPEQLQFYVVSVPHFFAYQYSEKPLTENPPHKHIIFQAL